MKEEDKERILDEILEKEFINNTPFIWKYNNGWCSFGGPKHYNERIRNRIDKGKIKNYKGLLRFINIHNGFSELDRNG